jgi:hypothetical protein
MEYFVFNGLRWEAVVYFVDIGGIVAHHCINFLFVHKIIIQQWPY